MEHIFLVNPAAGKEDPTPVAQRAAAQLEKALGEPCTIQISRAPGELTELARKAGASGNEVRLYACGGDGTFHEVVAGAMEFPNVAVTCLPLGSGNDFIKQFPHPEAFFRMEEFENTVEKRLDLMDVSGCVAVNVCSVGFDARIGTQIDRYRRLPLLSGPRAYWASVVVNLIRGVVKPCRVELQEGPVVGEDMTLACVCNGSWYGGSFHPVPEADSSDGLLDVLLVKKVSRLTVARVIAAYQKGHYADYPNLIAHYQTKRLRIVTPEKEPVNLDGELIHSRDITIQLLPGKLRLFGPAAAWEN